MTVEERVEQISVTAREASKLTGLSVQRIYELVRAGELEVRYPYRGKRNFVILAGSLRAWVQSLPDEPPDT